MRIFHIPAFSDNYIWAIQKENYISVIDPGDPEAVKRIIDNAYNRTKKLLTEKKEELEKIANKLLEKEILFQNDLETLIGKRPFESKQITQEEDKDEINKITDDNSSDKEEK